MRGIVGFGLVKIFRLALWLATIAPTNNSSLCIDQIFSRKTVCAKQIMQIVCLSNQGRTGSVPGAVPAKITILGEFPKIVIISMITDTIEKVAPTILEDAF